MIVNSPITGKPMRVVYQPDVWPFRGKEYPYVHIAFRDEESGEQFTTDESDTACYLQATNQYRAEYGIPYADEIVALRERYGLSASKMAVILGFGANQYRLYEMGEVPSESNGKMIRSASNPKVFLDLVHGSRHQLSEKEYDKICSQVQNVIADSEAFHNEQMAIQRLFLCERGLCNGFAPLSTKRLKNLLLYVLGQVGDTFQTKMNKILFYIDFLSYRERGMAISGLAYNAIEFGPVPQRWDRVYSAFDEVVQQPRLVYDQECVALTTKTPADTACFEARELAIIDTVCAKLKDMNAHDISALSHEEPSWKNHLHCPETIPYPEAFSLVAL
ncbi:MAG: DUF4065 domain-containing protein [Bacteroidales bacterium]|nr:DUF4065 domain-containing protein [Bacteroidales bacterium]